jgi:hypothetical protein
MFQQGYNILPLINELQFAVGCGGWGVVVGCEGEPRRREI